MTWLIVLAAVIVVVFLLYLLALRCEKRRGEWDYFRKWRYAHWGYHDKPRIPENSLPAFRRAVQCGFGAELDVHLMKDGHLAVIHDASLRRTAGADVEIEDLTAEELKNYTLEGTEHHIPLLEEVLPIFAGKAPLIIELKAERGNADALPPPRAPCWISTRANIWWNPSTPGVSCGCGTTGLRCCGDSCRRTSCATATGRTCPA